MLGSPGRVRVVGQGRAGEGERGGGAGGERVRDPTRFNVKIGEDRCKLQYA
jgi:hypothetical protein